MNNQQILFDEVKKYLDSTDVAFEPIDKGVMSKVFNVTTTRDNYILRYDTAEESRYPLEARAMDTAREKGIPTPKSIRTSTIDLENNKKINYMLQERLYGKALSDDLPSNIDKLLEQTGVMLKKLHSIKTERFGHLRPDRVGVVRSWPEFMFYHFKSSNSDYLEEVDFLTTKELDKATYLINDRLSRFNLKQGYMLHVDLSLDHIFHYKDEVEGLIDFQNVGSGDPLYDIATFEFYSETKYPDKEYSLPLIKGYGLNVDSKVKEAITFYKLCLAIWKITGRIKSKREDSVPRVHELTKEYIKELD
ncbi:phosphotransferase [bacterium]|nr:phosphotransferase [bacterium]